MASAFNRGKKRQSPGHPQVEDVTGPLVIRMGAAVGSKFRTSLDVLIPVPQDRRYLIRRLPFGEV